MGTLDDNTVRDVWARVQQARSEHSPAQLAQQEQELTRQLRKLAGRHAGKNRAALLRMAGQCAKSAQVLYSMCDMSGQNRQAYRPNSRQDALLRRCFAQMVMLCREYEKRIPDPQFGPVYAQLAQQKQMQCHTLLSLQQTLI